MTRSVDKPHRPAPNRIIYWILVPVVSLGILFALLIIRYTTPPLTSHITDQLDSNLKLASELGLQACEDRFNYLLDLRLEGDIAVNNALKYEVLEEIKTAARAFPNIHTLVLKGRGEMIGSSQPLELDAVADLSLSHRSETVIPCRIGNRPVRLHHRFFPFWNWQIITYIDQQDYHGPVQMVRRSVYFGTLGMLLLLTVTLTVVIRIFVTSPLKRLIAGTRDVAEARYQPLAEKGSNEIGQLMRAFNQMIDRLAAKDEDLNTMLREVRQTEKRFRTLFESAPLGFGLIDTTGRLLEANSTMQRLLGTETQPDSADLNFYDFFHRHEDASTFRQEMAQKPSLAKFECDLVRPEERWSARLTASSYSLSGKSVTLITAEDVSRERKLEMQLQRAHKMEAIGSLAGCVAHDLNNILASTVGYPELMLMELPKDSPLRNRLAAIKQSGEKAAIIVQDLLTMARRGVSVEEVVNLNAIVAEYQSGAA